MYVFDGRVIILSSNNIFCCKLSDDEQCKIQKYGHLYMEMNYKDEANNNEKRLVSQRVFREYVERYCSGGGDHNDDSQFQTKPEHIIALLQFNRKLDT